MHRDVKPGNILVGADGLVKITDFGIAHAAGSAPITGPGLVMGTTQYMAPERIAGGQATPASDLYALGILIYECLTGLPPYDGGTAEVMAGHLYLPIPPLPAGVPPGPAPATRRPTVRVPAPAARRVARPQPVQLREPLPRADPDDHVTRALADAPAAADLPRPVGTGVRGGTTGPFRIILTGRKTRGRGTSVRGASA